MPPAATLRLLPASVRPFDAMNGISLARILLGAHRGVKARASRVTVRRGPYAARQRPLPLLAVGPGQLPGLRAPDPARSGGGAPGRPAAELRELLRRAPPAQGPGARAGLPRHAPRRRPQ